MGELIERSAARQRGRAARRWLRRVVVGLAAVLVVGALVYAWLPSPIPVEIARAAPGPLQVTVDEDGRAQVLDRYVVSAPVGGGLGRLALHPGDRVEAGAVLARLLPAPPPLLDERSRASSEERLGAAATAQRQARVQIVRGEAAAELARAEAGRARSLSEQDAVPPSELERALLAERTAAADLASLRFAARIADHEVEMARIALRHASGKDVAGEQVEIRTPAPGQILKVLRESEGLVAAGTPLLELGDPAALELVVDVLTSDAVRIQPGALARVDGWGGPALEARVRRVEPSAFTRLSSLGVEEQRVNVRLELTEPRARWAALGDGYRVEVHIVVWERADALKVPASAVFRHGEAWATYRVAGGVARRCPVTLGERTGREVQVLEGLERGDLVVTYPSDRIADGVNVTARAP